MNEVLNNLLDELEKNLVNIEGVKVGEVLYLDVPVIMNMCRVTLESAYQLGLNAARAECSDCKSVPAKYKGNKQWKVLCPKHAIEEVLSKNI